MELKEKKEAIFNSYRLAFDKEMAFAKANLTPEEREEIENDEEFLSRMTTALISQREVLIERLMQLSKSPDEQISFKATIELGKILYPHGFIRTGEDDLAKKKKDEYNTPEEDERIRKEYEYLLTGGKKSTSSKP